MSAGAGRGRCLIIQFAKAPQPGRVKTRMLPQLTRQEAYELHCQLMVWTCNRLLESQLGDVELWLSKASTAPAVQQCQALGVQALRYQRGADLGQRMCHALLNGLSRYSKVLLVGSDCPQLDPDYLQSAQRALDEVDVVLGPARDGGYVLIGGRRIDSALFEGVAWGEASVYSATTERLQRSGFSWRSLAQRQDIDRPEDLPAWERARASMSPPAS